MSRSEMYFRRQRRKQILVAILCGVIAFGTPLVGFTAQQYAMASLHPVFGTSMSSHSVCGILCQIIGGAIAWAVAKGLDWYYANSEVPMSSGFGCNGACGGGGGRPF
ncbi:MAG: hypothetical protein HRJ53_29510 [Acidobacteria bacterium Pan2503]|uniref:Uncharacterized protein n=1 Tax=Candidatus Acidiferrum panamense TaxID=2741543 RepID=A0A7V8NX81_9BACT|nr:hypothetical protein [Candidatus Acidoferrum panamensis]